MELLPLIFILGLAFGSFSNVLVYRLNEEKAPKFWQGRSLCPQCKKILPWYDNIPLLSFLLLKGQCRFCKKKISWHYPVVELLTAIAFVVSWLIVPSPLLLGMVLAFIVILFSDLIYGLIPDEMVILLIALGLGQIFLSGGDFVLPLIVAVTSCLGFLAVVVATRFRGMGLGDVKLAFAMGLLLSFPNILVALWVGFVSGGVVAVIMLLLNKTKLSATIPLGPFLVLGTLTAALWSKELLALLGL